MSNEEIRKQMEMDGGILVVVGPKDYKPNPTMQIYNSYKSMGDAKYPDDGKTLAGGRAEKDQNKDKPDGHQNNENDINASNTGNKKGNL